MIENTGSIDSLESEVLVIKMSDEQTLRGESVRLNVDIGSGNTSQETGLSDIGITTDQEGSGIRIDRRETTQMLADLVEI